MTLNVACASGVITAVNRSIKSWGISGVGETDGVSVMVGVRVAVGVGVWVAFGENKGAGFEVGRTGFAVGRAIVGMGEGSRVGLGVGT